MAEARKPWYEYLAAALGILRLLNAAGVIRVKETDQIGKVGDVIVDAAKTEKEG